MSESEIYAKAGDLLMKNTFSGYSKVYKADIHYMKPGPDRYPYQYFWDTCFHTYIMTALGQSDTAKNCLRTLFMMQEEDGFVGHMLYWNRFLPRRITDLFQKRPSIKHFFKPHMSSLIQPPLAADAVLKVYNSTNDMAFVFEMLTKLKKYYNWLSDNRDFEKNGLISIITYFEAGMDWKPSYDQVINVAPAKGSYKLFLKVIMIDLKNFLNGYDLKKICKKNYFNVKDTLINTFYAQNLLALSSLCRIANDPDEVYYEKKASQTIQSIFELMYDKEDAAFYDLSQRDYKKLKILTPTIFFPLIFKQIPDDIASEVIKRHLFNENEFAVRYPIPSVAINNPGFDPEESLFIWRGPTWIVFNWFLQKCLMQRGYWKEAENMANVVKELIAKGGFREYYNPFTGEGYGATDFTWSGLVVDMMETVKKASM